ncbi:sulfatase-like hydrolase/transferase [Halobacteriales archaeon Cl-PHB]
MTESVFDYLSDITVSNVYLYVADSVRLDALPEYVAAKGISATGVASSIHSPTSFASLVSGRYPPATGVYSFSHRVNSKTLFDMSGIHTCYESTMIEGGGADDSLFSVFGIDPTDSQGGLSTITEPFIALERGNGGHAPYADSSLSAWEYFRQNGDAAPDQFRQEYEEQIKRDAGRFHEKLELLEQRDLSSETLVIYTADHGELLGEGGLLGHNSPMRPELVYVPVVFIHPDLPSGRSVSTLVRHVDLLPTILDLLADVEDQQAEFAGESLTTQTDRDYGLSFYDSQFFSDRVPGLSGRLIYEGAWDNDGGHVFSKSPLRDRLTVFGGKLFKSAKREFLRRKLPEATYSYLRGSSSYGDPEFNREIAHSALVAVNDGAVGRTEIELSSDASDRLRDLGYL